MATADGRFSDLRISQPPTLRVKLPNFFLICMHEYTVSFGWLIFHSVKQIYATAVRFSHMGARWGISSGMHFS